MALIVPSSLVRFAVHDLGRIAHPYEDHRQHEDEEEVGDCLDGAG